MKGQGALEYLIIVAAVLAIAAIVVMFLTGAFKGSQPQAVLSACRTAASNCANYMATTGATSCQGTPLEDQCQDACNSNLLAATNEYSSAADACKNGDVNAIVLSTTKTV